MLSLPSKIAKFVNPMASNRRLTISNSSGIYKKDQQAINMVNFQNDIVFSVVCSLVAHLVLQLLHISCNEDQLFSGQGAGTPALTATFIHRRPAGGGGC